MDRLIAATLVIGAILIQLPETKQSISINESINPAHTFTQSGSR